MKNPIITIIAALVVGGATFFGGVQYQKTQASGPMQGQFREANGGVPQGGFQGRGGNGQGTMPVSGEIIASDENSITVKLQDGSSKIVLVSDTTVINKAESGAKEDLKASEKVLVLGNTNSDGSISAQSIQLNPQDRTMFREQEQ